MQPEKNKIEDLFSVMWFRGCRKERRIEGFAGGLFRCRVDDPEEDGAEAQRVEGGLWVQDAGFREQGSGFRVQGPGYKDQRAGCRVVWGE